MRQARQRGDGTASGKAASLAAPRRIETATGNGPLLTPEVVDTGT